jgi:hypothetical protein
MFLSASFASPCLKYCHTPVSLGKGIVCETGVSAARTRVTGDDGSLGAEDEDDEDEESDIEDVEASTDCRERAA